MVTEMSRAIERFSGLGSCGGQEEPTLRKWRGSGAPTSWLLTGSSTARSRLAGPNKSLTKRSGLAHVAGARIYLVMSLNVFIAICVLACDFLIYAFFQWTFGEKHREVRRRHSLPMAERKKNAIEIRAPRRYEVGRRAVEWPGTKGSAGRRQQTEQGVA